MPQLNGNELHDQSREHGNNIFIGGQPKGTLAKKIDHDDFWQGIREEGLGFAYIPKPERLNFGVNDPNIKQPELAVESDYDDDDFDIYPHPDEIRKLEIEKSNNINYLYQRA